MYELLDADHSGFISVAEVMRLVNEGGDGIDRTALPQLFDYLDSRAGTRDGKLEVEEWVSGIMESMAQRTQAEFNSFCDGLSRKLEHK